MGDHTQQTSEFPPYNLIFELDRNTAFIHDQYKDLMKNLHDEIDQLRSANRDLQFQIVLLQQNQERSENRDCGSNSFELDCHSRQCILRMKCERCQNYTPVRVTNLKPNSRMKSSQDNDNCSLQNDNLRKKKE
ncbi:uncharacterized protein LOC103517975 [Diaphorina citri]|uniref:Uncharacterized protein LOC103517975 n=1 Tax=Diaphorina citri TaxID=121845 RepID=A0A1S4ELT6_DIACI|nr:uncharacterized protein LOC103517975 [Diaphorina citri]